MKKRKPAHITSSPIPRAPMATNSANKKPTNGRSRGPSEKRIIQRTASSSLSAEQQEHIRWEWTSGANEARGLRNDEFEASALERLRDDARMHDVYTMWLDLREITGTAPPPRANQGTERRGALIFPTMIRNALRIVRSQKKTRASLRRDRQKAVAAARKLATVVRDLDLERSIFRYRPDDEAIAAWLWPTIAQLASERSQLSGEQKWQKLQAEYVRACQHFTRQRGGWWNAFSHVVHLFANDLEEEIEQIENSARKQILGPTSERVAFIEVLAAEIYVAVGVKRSAGRERQRHDIIDEIVAVVASVAFQSVCSVKDVQNALRRWRKVSVRAREDAAPSVYLRSFSLAVQPDFSGGPFEAQSNLKSRRKR